MNFFLLSLSSRSATISFTSIHFLGFGLFHGCGNGFVWNWLLAVFLFSFSLSVYGIAFGAIRSFTGFSLYIFFFYIYYFFLPFPPSLLIHILSRSCAGHSDQRIR